MSEGIQILNLSVGSELGLEGKWAGVWEVGRGVGRLGPVNKSLGKQRVAQKTFNKHGYDARWASSLVEIKNRRWAVSVDPGGGPSN